ncbi:MAG TPA: RidA family protein [Candidatus Binatia bacterium]|nr:RidA family protein [Candidatus Binatia bacterium]
MVYVSSVGPVDPETNLVVKGGIKEHTRQALANLKARLEEAGSSLDRIVWANWSLKEPGDFEIFNEEWAKVFEAGGPVGQSVAMSPVLRRAGFRVSLAVIAEG